MDYFSQLDHFCLSSIFGGSDEDASKSLLNLKLEKKFESTLFLLHFSSILLERSYSFQISMQYLMSYFQLKSSQIPKDIPSEKLLFYIENLPIILSRFPRMVIVFSKLPLIFEVINPNDSIIHVVSLLLLRPECSQLFYDYLTSIVINLSDEEKAFNIVKSFLISVPEKERLRLIIPQVCRKFPKETATSFIHTYIKIPSTEPILRFIFNSSFCPILSFDDLILIFSFFILGKVEFHSNLFDSFINYCSRNYNTSFPNSFQITSTFLNEFINEIEKIHQNFSNELFNLINNHIETSNIPILTFDIFFLKFSFQQLKQISLYILNSNKFISYLQIILKYLKNKNLNCLNLFSILVCGYYILLPSHIWSFQWITRAILLLNNFYFLSNILTKTLDLLPKNKELALNILEHLSKFDENSKILLQLLNLSINKNIDIINSINFNSNLLSEEIIRIYSSDIIKDEFTKKDFTISLSLISSKLNKNEILNNKNIPNYIKENLKDSNLIDFLRFIDNPLLIKVNNIKEDDIKNLINKIEINQNVIISFNNIDEFLFDFIESDSYNKNPRYISDEYGNLFLPQEELIIKKKNKDENEQSIYGFLNRFNPFSK